MMSPTKQARRAIQLTLSFDISTAFISMAAALFLRWWQTDGLPPDYAILAFVASLTFAVSALTAFILVRVHRQVWRHIGLDDAIKIVQAVGLAALLFLPLLFLWNRLVGLPRSSLLLAVAIWTIFLFAGRMVALVRTTQRPFQFFRRAQNDAPKAVLVGDSQSVAAVIRSLRAADKGPKVRALGLLATDTAQPGRAIRGVPVMGDVRQLEYVLEILQVRYGEIPWVAVTGEARTPAVMNEILEIVARMGTKIIALAPSESAPELVDLRTADLLSRPERCLDVSPVEKLVGTSRVLVTGGGGTIGLELARQCLAQKPAELTLFDASEFNLYRADLLLRREFPDVSIKAVLGDVRDVTRLEDVIDEMRPDLVIHAAALKHVPLMEQNVCEAILTNVEGAINVARAAVKAGSRRFVFISTDKAVDPDNVMGATKRLAEIAVARIARKGPLRPALVRFGNVLGSAGSVVPLFNEQIETGGPVTVTHPDVTRYFMTVEEAAALVLQAGALVDEREEPGLFVLDMGEPIRIVTLAESMIRMRGFVPGRDIRIEFSGLRPGEKLNEELAYEFEDISKTRVDGILKVRGMNGVDDSFDLMLASLVRAAQKRERNEALALLGKLVPEYAATRRAGQSRAAGA